MPFSLDIDGNITLGAEGREDKRLTLTPRAPDGSATSVSDITLDLTSPSTSITLTKADFTENGDEWFYDIEFDEVGEWDLSVTMVGVQGAHESIDKTIWVHND